jgi:hypothetical protein
MTTYTQSLIKKAERTQKAAVRDFLFSFFAHLQLNKIVGLAGPNIQDYISFLKSKGFTEFEIYEMDKLTAIHQLTNLNERITLKLGDIINASADELNTLYDLDYCVTVRHMHEHIAKFKNNFIMTFARRVPFEETIGTFFSVRDEKVVKSYIYDAPIKHTIYESDKGKYVYIPYKDTSPMCCFAKIA